MTPSIRTALQSAARIDGMIWACSINDHHSLEICNAKGDRLHYWEGLTRSEQETAVDYWQKIECGRVSQQWQARKGLAKEVSRLEKRLATLKRGIAAA